MNVCVGALARPRIRVRDRAREVAVAEEFPIDPIELANAVTMCAAIDKHRDFETRLQGRDQSPKRLCPEQKRSVVSDIANAPKAEKEDRQPQ